MRATQIILLVFIFITTDFFSQPAAIERNKAPYRWMVGVSGTGIYNTLTYIDFKGNNTPICFLPYPTQLSIDTYRRKGWSREWIFSHTQSKFINYVGDTFRLQAEVYSSIDYYFKHSFNRFMYNEWIDPFILSGLGVTLKKNFSTNLFLTYNLGVGVNFWLTKHLAFQLRVSMKLAINSNTFTKDNSNYLQLGSGFVYKINATSKNQNRRKRNHLWVHRHQRKHFSIIKI